MPLLGAQGKAAFLRASTGNNGANETTILSSSRLEGMHRAERYLTGQHRENQLHKSSRQESAGEGENWEPSATSSAEEAWLVRQRVDAIRGLADREATVIV